MRANPHSLDSGEWNVQPRHNEAGVRPRCHFDLSGPSEIQFAQQRQSEERCSNYFV